MIYDPCHRAGGMTAYEWERDPKRIGFILARYKFVAKMLYGETRVLEVGCADGFGSRVVRTNVNHLTAIDLDPKSIAVARRNNVQKWPVEFRLADFFDYRKIDYSAVYCLDVLEHIPKRREDLFLQKLRWCGAKTCIIGMPSLESQPYASKLSKKGHINCKTQEGLRGACLQHWDKVFMFGMNDEVLHTGFGPMCQYRFALCVS